VILSVDDDAVNQTVIEILLEGSGYDVIQAMDGVEALEVLESRDQLPDLILLDVMMPRMSGYEVCRKIREIYPASLPVVMISAKSSKEDIIQGLECRCNDYVTKPFDKDELLARIDILLNLNDLRSEQRINENREAVKKLALPKPIPPIMESVVAVEIISEESVKPFTEFLARKFDLIPIPNRIGCVLSAIECNGNMSSVVEFITALCGYSGSDQRLICAVARGHCMSYNFDGPVPSLVMYGPVMDSLTSLVSDSTKYRFSEGGCVVVTNRDLEKYFSKFEKVANSKDSIAISITVSGNVFVDDETERIHVRPVWAPQAPTEPVSDALIDSLRARKNQLVSELGSEDLMTTFDELESTIGRLKSQLGNLESEYREKTGQVNEALRNVLQFECLNERLFMEIKRKQFELGPHFQP
jgi:CheY-like chemotaxis protein